MEHDQLASRHEQLLLESEETKGALQRQIRTDEVRHSTQSQEQSEMISQLRQEVEDVTNAFKSQLHSLQEDHHKVGQMTSKILVLSVCFPVLLLSLSNL